MNEELDLTYLECSGVKRQKHFLVKPFSLACGHFMCFDCIEKEKDGDINVECGICKCKKIANLENNHASTLINEVIKTHLKQLFDAVNDKFTSILNETSTLFSEKHDKVEFEYEYLKQEIEIRAESLKNEIDELCKKIYGDLDAQKNRISSNIEAFYLDVRNSEQEIKDKNKNNTENQSIEIMQEKLERLYELKQNLHDYDERLQISETSSNLDLEYFGYFNHVTQKTSKNLIIPSKFHRHVAINLKAYDFCVLAEKQLIIADYASDVLCLFDKDFKILKKIEKIEKDVFEPFNVATNGIDKLYLSDGASNRILMTDFKFNLLGVSAPSQLTDPRGICYANNLLYVCGFSTKTVHTFKEDLSLDESFQLDFTPWYIKVINETVCVRHENEPCISFYKLPEFSLKYRYYGHNGSICIANSKFYEFYHSTSTIYCYNSDGTISSKDEIQLQDEINLNCFSQIFYFQNKFMISSTKTKSIIMPFN